MNAPEINCWSVALARARGKGVFGMVVHSSSRICLHLGAMGRSHSGVELRPRLSLVHCSGSVEEHSARMYVKAESCGCGSIYGWIMDGYLARGGFGSKCLVHTKKGTYGTRTVRYNTPA